MVVKNIKTHIFRLMPNAKLAEGVLNYCKNNNIKSAIVLSLLGSLNNIELGFLKKLPGEFIKKKFAGPLEITVGTGTIAQKDGDTILHIHLQVSNETMSAGGHLVEAEIFSTAEIVLSELDTTIERYFDSYTGLNELK